MIFKRTKKEMDKLLEQQLESLLREAKTKEDIFEVLSLMKKWKELKENKKQISSDTLLIVLGNLLGIVLILNYEGLGNVTSKALGFVIRGRI